MQPPDAPSPTGSAVTSCLNRLFALVLAHRWKSVDGVAIVGTRSKAALGPLCLTLTRVISTSGQLLLGIFEGSSKVRRATTWAGVNPPAHRPSNLLVSRARIFLKNSSPATRRRHAGFPIYEAVGQRCLIANESAAGRRGRHYRLHHATRSGDPKRDFGWHNRAPRDHSAKCVNLCRAREQNLTHFGQNAGKRPAVRRITDANPCCAAAVTEVQWACLPVAPLPSQGGVHGSGAFRATAVDRAS